MNKKNITINTDFFDVGIQAKLKSYHTDSLQGIDAKKRTSSGKGIHNSRYEHVPDNEYSTAYEVYEMPAQSIKKLQATKNFQNIISRAMANLFVRCWQQMKGKLPQYSYLVEKTRPGRINDQILEDYNTIFNNNSEERNECDSSQNRSGYSQNKQTLNERKNQIMSRQKKGFTLDSLSKEKLSRSKQKIKEPAKIKQRQNSELQGSAVSRKSYRQKFLNYKHRSKSKDFNIQHSVGYPKILHQIPIQEFPQIPSFNRGIYQSSKIQILQNINDLLMDRQEIYQGQNCNYYINHRDSSKNMFLSSAHHYHPLSTQFNTLHQNEQHEILRTKLIQQIVNKLQYSKLRLEEITKTKNNEEEIILKIDKLEKIILQLKRQEKISQNKQHQPQIIHYKIQDRERSQSQNLDFYKKIIDEIYSLRSDIKEIRTLRSIEPKQIIQVTNPQTDLIYKQQKLLNSYQQEFRRIVNEREKINAISYKQPDYKIQTAKKDYNHRIKSLNNDDFCERYRYTRNQILQDIGLKTQIQEQQRIMKEERQKKQKETKLMVENVKDKKITINQPKPTRNMYEKQWEKYQKTKIDSQEKSNPLCVLFPC